MLTEQRERERDKVHLQSRKREREKVCLERENNHV